MKSDKRIDYETRDAILKLLTDGEIARVSTAETAAHLEEGDEYLDLEQLALGVRRAAKGGATTSPMGRVLPRKSVQPGTWTQVLALMAKAGIVGVAGHALEGNGGSRNGRPAAEERFLLLAAVDDSDSALEVVSAAAGFARLIQSN
jgi:hypothetical protein